MKRFSLLFMLLGACAIEDETASTEQGLGSGLVRYGCGGLADCVYDLAPATQTCVLGGITGNLASGGHVVITAANQLQMSPGLMAWATCFNAVVDAHATWHTGNAATVIAAGAYSGGQCFLSGIANDGANAFTGSSSFASVTRTGDDYALGGTFPAGSDITLTAACLTAPLESFHSRYVTSTLTEQIAAAPAACGLTGFGGTVNSVGRGVSMRVDQYPSSYRWYWTLTGGTKAEARCIE